MFYGQVQAPDVAVGDAEPGERITPGLLIVAVFGDLQRTVKLDDSAFQLAESDLAPAELAERS